MVELFFVLGIFALALIVVPCIVAFGGSALWSLLLDDEPEAYLSDRAARRTLLRG